LLAGKRRLLFAGLTGCGGGIQADGLYKKYSVPQLDRATECLLYQTDFQAASASI
jgi:hypothetical protein